MKNVDYLMKCIDDIMKFKEVISIFIGNIQSLYYIIDKKYNTISMTEKCDINKENDQIISNLKLE